MTQVQHSPTSRLFLALFLFLFAVYLLTASGHTYSPDEESLIYVTQSFVTRGDFNLPNPDQFPVVGGHRGIGGKIYSGTGLAQSLLTLPLYVAGDKIANVFDSHFHTFILRLFIVSLFNALITALTGVLFFAWLWRLHGSPRVALALVLVWAFATMTWIYARTFFSEPLLTLCFVLSGYSICTYHQTRAARWMLVTGLVTGFAILTKVQGALLLPALGIYFFALEFKRDWREFLRSHLIPSAFFVGALTIGMGLFCYYNFIRFGNPLNNGYGQVPQNFSILTGLYGLLGSSGKSVFLYAPLIILFFFAWPHFSRRHVAETLFCTTLIVTFIVFHARIDYWSGDGAWGPRYLVPTLPFWILPLTAILGEWWRGTWRRAFLLALVAAGLAVNALALSINFDTYIQLQPNNDARYFQTAASPILAHWNLLRERAGNWLTVLSTPNAVVLLKGFLATGDAEFLPRYLASRATLLVKSNSAQPLQMTLVANDYRPAQKEKRRLVFFANGIALQSQLLPTDDSGVLNYRVQIPTALARGTLIEIVTHGIESHGTSPMGDELGVHLQSLEVRAAEQILPILESLAIPPVPTADPKAMWGWFYQPAHAQFDFYWWYLYFSGLDERQVAALVSFFSLTAIVCLTISTPIIWRGLTATRSMLSSSQDHP